MAATLLARMFAPHGGTAVAGAEVLTVMVAVAGAVALLVPNTFELRHRWSPLPALAMAGLLVLSMLKIYGSGGTPFLYFQF
jgi:hypothetical protein